MGYLQQKRGRIILGCFLITSLLLVAFPQVDIGVSRLFFNGRFFSDALWWQKLFYSGLPLFLYVSIAAILAIYALNRLAHRHYLEIDGKKVIYVLAVLIVGAGLIVNVVLKGQFGRARPRDIEEFGGSKNFTPAFVISKECSDNCSFSSGHGAGGFSALALALALSRRRAIYVAALAFGGLVSFSRIASGAHFLSDSIVSFFVMLVVSDLLYHYMLSGPSAVVSHEPRGLLDTG